MPVGGLGVFNGGEGLLKTLLGLQSSDKLSVGNLSPITTSQIILLIFQSVYNLDELYKHYVL